MPADMPQFELASHAARPWRPAPLLRVPERSRTIFRVIMFAAAWPLLAGVVFFGYRALWTTFLCIGGCALFEWAYFRVTRTPALLGRTHALLTGMLLAMTMPPFVSWYVPLVASAFAIIVGKAIFGGVGHFLWQPALLGRLAVAAMFGASLNPVAWPLLSPEHAVTGDVRHCASVALNRDWVYSGSVGEGFDGVREQRPSAILKRLGDSEQPQYARLVEAITDLPSMADMMVGARPGAIGETASLLLAFMGLYLVYRHYVTWLLPASFVAAVIVTAVIAPVYLIDADNVVRTVWMPAGSEGGDVGLVYVTYHLVSGGLLLAAFFLATEMTTRPVTPMGQVLFGLGCGVLTIVLRQYTPLTLPAFVAVLVMNTTTPLLERFTRPRVLGGRRRWSRRKRA